MRYILFAFIFFVVNACAQKKKVRIAVAAIKQYCGGARPSAEMQHAAETPVPYANKTLILLWSSGRTDSVRTDAAGNLILNLKKGEYRLWEPWRFHKSAPGMKQITDFDQECLKTEWSHAYRQISVSKTGYSVTESAPIVQYCEWRLPCLSDESKINIPD